MVEQEEVKKSRGGQPGNHNRLKHGFYSRKLPPIDVRDINSYMFSGIKEEISLFRPDPGGSRDGNKSRNVY